MAGKRVQTDQVNGKQVISTGALVYCNTKYHKPYLARITETGEMDWQDKEYIGYGKHSSVYYVVEELQPDDLIQAAGGSGGNKYPFKGRVLAIDTDSIEVEEISDKDWSNLIAERKNGGDAAKLEEARSLLSRAIDLVGREAVQEMLKEA